MKVKSLSHVWLFATPWTAAYQAPPSMGFSRQEYWSGVPLPFSGDFLFGFGGFSFCVFFLLYLLLSLKISILLPLRECIMLRFMPILLTSNLIQQNLWSFYTTPQRKPLNETLCHQLGDWHNSQDTFTDTFWRPINCHNSNY